MIQRYLDASRATYELFRPWLPHISIAIIVGHVLFSILNVVQEQSESFQLRACAILVMLPYALCSFIEKANRESELHRFFLLAVFLTGPLFLLAGLLNELRAPNPDIVVVIRREYEFLASFGVFLLASVDLLVAFLIGTLLSALVFLIAVLSIPLSFKIFRR